jgi:hypothetical protein
VGRKKPGRSELVHQIFFVRPVRQHQENRLLRVGKPDFLGKLLLLNQILDELRGQRYHMIPADSGS